MIIFFLDWGSLGPIVTEPGSYLDLICLNKAKEKYRGVFEIQKSGDKKSSGEIGLDIRTHASPKVGQDQVFGGKRPLLACRTRCICSMEPLQNLVKSQIRK